MNGKLKALGLALVAALALSAVAASGAMAQGEEFHSDAKHTSLNVESNSAQVFETTAGTISCSEVTVSATVEEESTSQITATPSYNGCIQVGEEREVHVYMESCDYLFTSEVEGHAPVHIECAEAGDEIEIKVTTIFGELNCERVPAQTPTGGGVVYDEEEDGHVTINATVTGIEYTEVGVCGEGTTANDGTYAGEVTVSGEDQEGEEVDIWWE